MLNPQSAYAIASQWGSLMCIGDPGACFYAFHYGDGRPTSEAHRRRCLDYLDRHCLPIAMSRREEAPDDLDELRDLRAFFEATPLRPTRRAGRTVRRAA